MSDFERRFGRRPEGMWLAETAVDVETLEIMAGEGIGFTILEPHQASRLRLQGAESWTDSPSLDPRRVYRCPLPSGQSIHLFFYDGPISRAVAFERLLTRGEYLAQRLMGALDPKWDEPQLVNIATDGETYGHHHPAWGYGLAYALELLDNDRTLSLTNYGEFLAKHGATYDVEIANNTSCSCSHGVERWRSDCGCSIAQRRDWNQQWRGPLRSALDWLRDELAQLYEQLCWGTAARPMGAVTGI
ncbi:MAG: DUF3536 domain-containing protein [Myxococcota bacterium]